MLFERKIAVDLGSGFIRIYSMSGGRLTSAHNLIAYRDHTIIAVGDDAYAMKEKNPADVSIVSPVKNGMIADIELQEIILYRMLSPGLENLITSTFCFSVPSDMSTMQKRAYYRAVNGHWMRRNRVLMVEAPIADALAMGLDPQDPHGRMLVNAGDQTTRLSVLGEGRIIISREIPIGGLKINEAIIQEIRRRYNLQIGLKTAEKLKLDMGRLSDQSKETRTVVGLDSISGLPRREAISSYVVNAGIMNCMNELAAQMKSFLERIPPQVSYQISREGIYLAGGCARIPHMDQYLASYTGYTFNLSELYETSTVTGLSLILRDGNTRKWAEPVTQRKL